MFSYHKEVEIAKEVAFEAGRAVMFYYNRSYKITNKSPGNPVTQADIESEKIILKGLQKFNYGVLSEEMIDDKVRLQRKKVWIIDPLDGTKDFINKTSEFTIMIGLAEEGKSVLGVVYQPVKDTVYYAVKGQGSFKRIGKNEPIQLKINQEADFNKIIMFSSRFHKSKIELKIAKKIGIKNIKTCGSSLKVCLIAAGEGEVNFNPSNKTWEYDVCASDIILSEAGGMLTDMKGKKFIYNKENPRNEFGYVATNGLVHDIIIKELIHLWPQSK